MQVATTIYKRKGRWKYYVAPLADDYGLATN